MRSTRRLVLPWICLLAACSQGTEMTPPSSTGSIECAPGSWCWVRGRPLTVERDRGSIYAVGPDGAFQNWRDGRWIAHPIPTTRATISAWIGGASDIWASDDAGSLWRFDGSAWRERPAGRPIARLLGAPDGSLWAMTAGTPEAHGGSSNSAMLRRDGDSWVAPVTPFPYCLGGDFVALAAGEVWSAGLYCDDTGRVLGAEVRRHDGASWQLVGARFAGANWYPTLSLVEGRVRVHAAGYHEWNGTAWQLIVPPGYPQDLAPDEDAVSDGTAYVRVPRSFGCEGAIRLDAANAWCFGHGRIYFHDGARWSQTIEDPFAETQPADRFGAMPPALWSGDDTRVAWGAGPDDVYRARTGTRSHLEHFDGARWTVLLEETVSDIDGAGAADVWIATEGGLYHKDGAALARVAVPDPMARGPITIVHALGGGAVLAASERALLSFDGAWSLLYEAPPNQAITDVAGANRSDIWLTERTQGRSNDVALRRYDGNSWSQVMVDGLTMRGRLATARGETWLASVGFVTKLGANAGPRDRIAMPDWRDYEAALWVGDDGVWLTTDRQARRHSR